VVGGGGAPGGDGASRDAVSSLSGRCFRVIIPAGLVARGVVHARTCSATAVTCSGGVVLTMPCPRLNTNGRALRARRMRSVSAWSAGPPAEKSYGPGGPAELVPDQSAVAELSPAGLCPATPVTPARFRGLWDIR
jgi:hypothetical protein